MGSLLKGNNNNRDLGPDIKSFADSLFGLRHFIKRSSSHATDASFNFTTIGLRCQCVQ